MPTSPEAFEKLLYQFCHLHDVMARQQSLSQQQTEELGRCVALLNERINSSQPPLAPDLQKYLSLSLQKMTESLGAHIGKEASQVITYGIEPIVQKLQQVSEQAECHLGRTRAFLHYRFWRELFIMMACTVLVSLLVCSLFLTKPTAFNAEQMKLYQLGYRFNAVYQSLSEAERARLWQQLEKRHPNRLKSHEPLNSD